MRSSKAELDHPDLVRAVQAGDGAAISRVLDLCLPSLRYVLSRRFGLSGDEAEDVLQEVRIAFWRTATRFRGEASLETYLVQIACRRAVDHIRSRQRQAARSLALDDGKAARSEDRALNTVVDRHAMNQALEQLSPRQRSLISLFYLQAKSYQEIAAEMGITIGTVGSMKAEALTRLRYAFAAGSGEGNAVGRRPLTGRNQPAEDTGVGP